MSSRVLAGRTNDENGKPTLAAGVVSRNKRNQMLASAPDFTPPGKENVASRLAKNIAEDGDSGGLLAVDGASGRSSSDASDNTMDAGFLAETSNATFGSDTDDSSPRPQNQNAGVAGKKKLVPRLVERDDAAECDDDDYDDDDDGIACGGKVIYQDHSAMSPQNINVSMSTATSAFPAVKKFCTENADLGGGGSQLTTPTRSLVARRTLRTPVNRHDATMDSIVPTDIDESFALGGVGDMPPIAAPAFRSYAALLSPSSGDELQPEVEPEIQPYSGTPSPMKRRSPLREELHKREELGELQRRLEDDQQKDNGALQPDDNHVYALPRRTAAAGNGASREAVSTPRRADDGDDDVRPPGAKKLCTPALKKVQASSTVNVVTDSPVAPTAEHTAMIEKIKHLRGVIDRDSSLEKQARQALEHCLARDATGTQQELEAERLMLLAGMRSSWCTSEVERLRQQVAAPISSRGTTTAAPSACNVELTLSSVCIPLHLNFLTTVGRDQVAHFVVVARSGCDVIAMTHVQSSREIAGLGGELKFSDNLSLSPVPVNTSLDVELYYMVQGRKASNDGDLSVTPRKRASRLLGQHGPLSKLTPKKQRQSSSTLALSATPGAARMTRFALGASCQLSLSSLQTYSSFKMQEWSSHQLLHGNVDMRIVGCPLYSEHQHSGFLTWREEISGQPNWRRFWCRLDGVVLKAWQYPADEEAEADPIQTLDLVPLVTGDFKISAGAPSSLVCIRKNSVVIDVQSDTEDSKRFLFFADSRDNQAVWIAAFQQACVNLESWRALPR